MTKLRELLTREDVSLYQIVKGMGQDPRHRHAEWSKKLDARDGARMSKAQLQEILDSLNGITGKNYTIDDVDFEVTEVRMV